MISPVPRGRSNAASSHAIFEPTKVGVSSVMLVSQSMNASAAMARRGFVKAKILYMRGEFRIVGVFKFFLEGGKGGILHSDGENDRMSVSHDFSEELGEFVPAELLLGRLAYKTDGFGSCFAVFGGGLLRDGPIVIMCLVTEICKLDPPHDGDEIPKEWTSPYITIPQLSIFHVRQKLCPFGRSWIPTLGFANSQRNGTTALNGFDNSSVDVRHPSPWTSNSFVDEKLDHTLNGTELRA